MILYMNLIIQLADYISGTVLVPYYDELAMAHQKAVEAGLIA